MTGTGIIAAAVFLVCFSPAKAAGSAGRQLEGIYRLSAAREAGGLDGN